MRYNAITAELFKQNRANFVNQMKPNSVAIFCANEAMPKSADGHYKWRQSPDLFYLTGIDQENTFLILLPQSHRAECKEQLFVRHTSEVVMWWEGKKHTREEAAQVSGVDVESVHWSDSFEAQLYSTILQAETIYLNTNENDRNSNDFDTAEMQLLRKIQRNFPLHKYDRAAPLLTAQRTCKSPHEIELLSQAIAITNKGFHRALMFIKPGVFEYEVEAELTHEYLINRASGHAYEPIIATGENACVLHYITNNAQCQDGDLLLMDCAAEYGNYNADLTRTVPVNGRFTPRQKEVYNAVLRIHNAAKNLMKPGMVLWDFNKHIGDLMEKELLDLKLLSKDDIAKQTKEKPAYKKYFPHGTAHFLGLDVHDVGDRYAKLPAGTVLTCEPGIYIREEKLGIRLENNILITDDEPVDLMQDIPIEAEHIEEIMNG